MWHPRKCMAPWLLKGSNVMLLVFILAFFDFAFLFLVSLSPVFVRFPPPPHLKPNLLKTHFNGCGSTLKLQTTHLKKTKVRSSGQSDRKASGCCPFVIRRKLWHPLSHGLNVSHGFHDIRVIAVPYISHAYGFMAPSFTMQNYLNDH